jgi:hypothetical protein
MATIYKTRGDYADPVVSDLIGTTADFRTYLEALAQMHPKVLGMGAIIGGQVRGIFVMTADGQYSPVGPDRMRTWARFFGNLSGELLEAFETELAAVKSGRRGEN